MKLITTQPEWYMRYADRGPIAQRKSAQRQTWRDLRHDHCNRNGALFLNYLVLNPISATFL